MAEAKQNRGTSTRGFASMDPEQQRKIASKGGKAAHAAGRAHEFSTEEAREAGRKGGQSTSRSREQKKLQNQQSNVNNEEQNRKAS